MCELIKIMRNFFSEKKRHENDYDLSCKMQAFSGILMTGKLMMKTSHVCVWLVQYLIDL